MNTAAATADRELIRQNRCMELVLGNTRKTLDNGDGADEQRDRLRVPAEAALGEHVEWAVVHRQRRIEAGMM